MIQNITASAEHMKRNIPIFPNMQVAHGRFINPEVVHKFDFRCYAQTVVRFERDGKYYIQECAESGIGELENAADVVAKCIQRLVAIAYNVIHLQIPCDFSPEDILDKQSEAERLRKLIP
jgi:hypothetical protein